MKKTSTKMSFIGIFALLIGFVGIVLTSIGGYFIYKDNNSSDSYTGFYFTLAGVVTLFIAFMLMVFAVIFKRRERSNKAKLVENRVRYATKLMEDMDIEKEQQFLIAQQQAQMKEQMDKDRLAAEQVDFVYTPEAETFTETTYLPVDSQGNFIGGALQPPAPDPKLEELSKSLKQVNTKLGQMEENVQKRKERAKEKEQAQQQQIEMRRQSDIYEKQILDLRKEFKKSEKKSEEEKALKTVEHKLTKIKRELREERSHGLHDHLLPNGKHMEHLGHMAHMAPGLIDTSRVIADQVTQLVGAEVRKTLRAETNAALHQVSDTMAVERSKTAPQSSHRAQPMVPSNIIPLPSLHPEPSRESRSLLPSVYPEPPRESRTPPPSVGAQPLPALVAPPRTPPGVAPPRTPSVPPAFHKVDASPLGGALTQGFTGTTGSKKGVTFNLL